MSRAVIFDFDGTLADTLTDLAASMNRLLALEGHPEHPVDAYKMFVGSGILNMIRAALPEGAEAGAEALKEPFVDHYKEHCLVRTALYPGVAELLGELEKRKIPAAVLTNKAEPLAVRMAEALFPPYLRTNLRGARPGVPLKPEPSSALAMAERLGVDPGEILLVGDSRMDMETAVNAGMTGCGVLWGVRSREELERAGAQDIVSHPRQILPLLGAG